MKKTLAERVKSSMAIGEFRKVSDLAKSMRATPVDVRNCVDDVQGLDLIVGLKTWGGIASLDVSDYQIERYE